jgi:hypothetical protein
MRSATAVLLALGSLSGVFVHGMAAPASPAEDVAVGRFLADIEKAPVAYQARRRLEASSSKLNESAWMEVTTEYTPQTGLHYEVIAQGGSERIRNRVLTKVLEGEKENSVQRERLKGRLSRENYDFNFDGRTPDGMIKVQLSPRRRDSRLVNGSAVLSPASGALVRVEGRLSKSPSFWVRWVSVSRRYAPIAGAMMPVSIETTADVRIAGVSTFEMTYVYQMVDGHAVTAAPQILASK